jgi:hypothetical protein
MIAKAYGGTAITVFIQPTHAQAGTAVEANMNSASEMMFLMRCIPIPPFFMKIAM